MSATGEKLKPASSMTRTHSALVNVVKSVKQTRKLRALQLRPGPSKRAQWLLLVLGLDPSRSIWGLKPYDLKWPGRDSEAWFQQVVAARKPPKRPSITRVRVAATGRPQHRGSTRAPPLWSSFALLRGDPSTGGPSERLGLSCTHLDHCAAGAPCAARVGRLPTRDSSVRRHRGLNPSRVPVPTPPPIAALALAMLPSLHP